MGCWNSRSSDTEHAPKMEERVPALSKPSWASIVKKTPEPQVPLPGGEPEQTWMFGGAEPDSAAAFSRGFGGPQGRILRPGLSPPNGSELCFSPVSVTALARLLDARGVGPVLCARLMHFLTRRRHQLVLQRHWRRRRRSSASRRRRQLLLPRLDQHLTMLLLPRELGMGVTRLRKRWASLCNTL